MGTMETMPRRGLWAHVAAQPVSLPIVGLPFAIGLLGAAVVGFTGGFRATDELLAGDVRLWGALLTGLAAGVVGRGLWGWVAASAGATLGVSPYFLSDAFDLSIVLGAAILSCVVLTPGYALARAVASALRFLSLSAEGRSAALRGPLRRILRLGAVLSGAGLAVAALAAIGLSEDATIKSVVTLAIVAAVGGSYVMYRLVDRLDRGDRTSARVFTVIYGVAGLGLVGLMLAAGAPVARALLVSLVPSGFMALAPWLLVRLVREQALAMPLRIPSDGLPRRSDTTGDAATHPTAQGADNELAIEAMRAVAATPPAPTKWGLIWGGAGVTLLLSAMLAAYFIVEASPGSGCRESEGWAYLWLIFSPMIAVVSVGVMGVVALAAGAAGSWAALLVAPALSWVAGYVLAVEFNGACVTSNVAWGVITIMLPATIGVGSTLFSVLLRARRK